MTSRCSPPGTSTEGRLAFAIRVAIERTMRQIGEQAVRVEEASGVLEGEGISAAIDFSGEVDFTLTLAIPQDTVAPLLKGFTGVPIGWDSNVLHDVVGELLNVLAGDVVAELAEAKIDVRMALPRVEPVLTANVLAAGATALHSFGVNDGHGAYRVDVFGKASAA